MLAFAFVGRKFQDATVTQMKCFVDVEKSLDPVVAGGKLGQAFDWISESRRIDDRRSAGREAVDIDAKDLLRRGCVDVDLEARFLIIILRNQQQDVAVEGRDAHIFAE